MVHGPSLTMLVVVIKHVKFSIKLSFAYNLSQGQELPNNC